MEPEGLGLKEAEGVFSRCRCLSEGLGLRVRTESPDFPDKVGASKDGVLFLGGMQDFVG